MGGSSHLFQEALQKTPGTSFSRPSFTPLHFRLWLCHIGRCFSSFSCPVCDVEYCRFCTVCSAFTSRTRVKGLLAGLRSHSSCLCTQWPRVRVAMKIFGLCICLVSSPNLSCLLKNKNKKTETNFWLYYRNNPWVKKSESICNPSTQS